MKKLYVDGVGEVVYWNDFILSRYFKTAEEPVIEYSQSNTKLDNYCYRTIGVTRKTNGYIISVALSKEELTPKTEKSGKGVVVHRIKKLISQGMTTTNEDKGITWVPDSYIDLLYKDSMTFNNIFGPIDPSFMKMAIKALQESEAKMVDNYYTKNARTK